MEAEGRKLASATAPITEALLEAWNILISQDKMTTEILRSWLVPEEVIAQRIALHNDYEGTFKMLYGSTAASIGKLGEFDTQVKAIAAFYIEQGIPENEAYSKSLDGGKKRLDA